MLDRDIIELTGKLKHAHSRISTFGNAEIYSPIERMISYNEMLAEGKKQMEIADYYSVTSGYVSSVLKLNVLPYFIHPMVHLETYKDYLHEVDTEGFNFPRGKDGQILTITWRNAHAMLDYLPTKASSDYQIKRDILLKVLNDMRVLEKASTMVYKDFKEFFAKELEKYGIEDGISDREVLEGTLVLDKRWKSKISEKLIAGDSELWDSVNVLKRHGIFI